MNTKVRSPVIRLHASDNVVIDGVVPFIHEGFA
jgi:hypothetical protein